MLILVGFMTLSICIGFPDGISNFPIVGDALPLKAEVEASFQIYSSVVEVSVAKLL